MFQHIETHIRWISDKMCSAIHFALSAFSTESNMDHISKLNISLFVSLEGRYLKARSSHAFETNVRHGILCTRG